MSYILEHMKEAVEVFQKLDTKQIETMVDILNGVRSNGGRLFILGVGGSAANASHAVNDFRKICGMEAYAPTDNVSELTARTNDEGWESVFVEWLKGSRLNAKDCIFVLSVGGGNKEKNVSVNLVHALVYAKEQQAKIIGVVGREGGYTAQVANACCLIPVVNPVNTTPHTEAFQAVVWHALVSHPKLKVSETKWESVR
jgi:D-sedoheptulose 7-phosphate isomerase